MFVKICGLRHVAEVETAVSAGADAVGFMFTASPRQVTPQQAAVLAEAAGDALTVGVFTTEPTNQVRQTVALSGVGGVQLHGDHPAEDFAALRDLPLTLIRAQAGSTASDTHCGARGEDFLLLDAPRPGSGETWDYRAIPGKKTGRWMLAGGLSPDNVASAIDVAAPWGVDVSSGVESSRGVKDLGLIAEFVAAAKEHS